jgi:DNA modification methylase
VSPLLTVLSALKHRISAQPESSELGQWIAGRRRTAGLSQQALAALVGVSKPTIIQIERGRGNIRSLLVVFDALAIVPSIAPQTAGDRPNAASHVIYEGDNLDHLKTLPDNSVDSVVTDPPYGLQYMASEWDGSVPAMEVWREVIRVLKPGGFLLSFGGTRTYHRMVVAVEDAGFEIRDQISWLYGQGMPKSRNISKDLDRIQGAKREVVGRIKDSGYARAFAELGGQTRNISEYDVLDNCPITADATKFDGYGTGLKPAQEPIVVAQKPFAKKHATAKNILLHGVGALNIDACRITGPNPSVGRRDASRRSGSHPGRPGEQGHNLTNRSSFVTYVEDRAGEALGRFPANVIHDGSPEVVASFPRTKSVRGNANTKKNCTGGRGERRSAPSLNGADEGSTARYFFCAKPSAKERAGNPHLTVKPVALMSHLVKLVTPAGGTVLDPYAGSGTTGVAALKDGFNAILMERDARSVAIIRRRMGEVTSSR